MSETIFAARALTKTYTSGEVEVQALRGLDLDVSAGEVVVLLGPSGSGKSTLLNIMGGLDHATSGRLLFKNIELTALNDRQLTAYRRRNVGFVFQFYNLIPSLTAYENVALVTEIAERPMKPDEALALVGLEARMDHFPAQLSEGEQQRVAIARAIAKRPEVLLCDEPTGALDSKTGIRVIEALLSVNAQLGTTTLIITHNASIQDVADRVLFFADGQISNARFMALSLFGCRSDRRRRTPQGGEACCHTGSSAKSNATGPKSRRCFQRRNSSRQASSTASGTGVSASQYCTAARLYPSLSPASACVYPNFFRHFLKSHTSIALS
jgi:putative ABC transport system ATP-binding protein